jgi:hypothetical protein
MDQEPTKAPHRYQRWDEYTIAEVGRRFASGSCSDRLDLLRECYAEGRSLPYEIASQVLNDPDPMMRLWMAKHARDLDLRERNWAAPLEQKPEDAEGATEERKPESGYKYPDRNLWEKLGEDKDPLVRAALYENPAAPRFAALKDLPQICRLAYMRNPDHGGHGLGHNSRQILALFDATDTSLGITESEREELVMAYLSNPAVIAMSHDLRCECVLDRSSEFYGELRYDCEKKRERLWTLLRDFPSAAVKERGFRYLGGEDRWKVEAYRSTEDRWLRMYLLLGASQTDVELLSLGAVDKEECCWEVARQKFIDPKKLKPGKPGMPVSGWRNYVFTALESAVIAAVPWAAFRLAGTPFEHLLLALVGLVYLGIEAGHIAREMGWERALLALDVEFRKLRRLVGERLSEEERLEQRWEDAAAALTLEQKGIARWIRIAGLSLASVYVLYQLYLVLRHGRMP